MRIKKVSVVMPARNEEETIGVVLSELEGYITRYNKYEFETIVVADHCTDGTADIARDRGVKVLINEFPPGKGNALRFGFKNSTGDVIVMLDSDGSHNPGHIGLFLEAIENGAGLVVGSRALGGSSEYEIVRLFGNAIFTLTFCILFSVKMTDALNGYKAFVRDVYTGHRYGSKGFDIEIELLAQAIRKGYRIAEVPSHEEKRLGGKMKSDTLIDGARFLTAIVKEGLKYRLWRLFRMGR